MTDGRHKQRASFDGFDRKRLRGTLTTKLGIVSNADVFASKGNTWETTTGEERREQQQRQMLERHLREADFSETRFIDGLLERLRDDGPPEPVPVNKQTLATEKKHGKPARRARQGAYAKVAMQVNRLAKLQRERGANERVGAVTADKRKEYGHFVLEKD